MPLSDSSRRALARIADVVCAVSSHATIGEITLRPHQRQAAARARRALSRDGGCLIAEDVGRGKTFIALALASAWRQPLLVIPAALRTQWHRAMHRAGVQCAVITHDALSRGAIPDVEPDGIIVDESHHFRNSATRRHVVLARLSAFAPIVLLSATPLQNRTRDLAAQLALYLGERAFTLNDDELARFVVRSGDERDAELPHVETPEWITLDADDSSVLHAILSLPPPARPRDGGDAGALRTITLVRAWASSRAALRSMLRQRIRLATAIEQSAEAGRSVTRAETRSWRGVEDVVQLGMAALLADTAASDADAEAIRLQLAHDRRAMERLAITLRDNIDPDAARVRAIRAVRLRHPSRRIIAFSEFASTILALYRGMRTDAGVGMLTANSAHIASGRVTRAQLLERFAPVAQEAPFLPAREQVTLLLTTDLLAEGVNLQDASVVIHLDLPWNPARLSQRVGRVCRPGGAARVHSYLIAPPAAASALLDAEARLRNKLELAAGAIGRGFTVLPPLPALTSRSAQAMLRARVAAHPIDVNAETMGTLFARIESWRVPAAPRAGRLPDPIVESVIAPVSGWFAALADGRLIATYDGAASDTASTVARLAALAEGERVPVDAHACERARRELDVWLAAEELDLLCGVARRPGPLRRRIVNVAYQLCATIPRHQRAAALSLARRLRDALIAPMPLGAERMIADGLALLADPEAAMIALGDAVSIAERARGVAISREQGRPALSALILFHVARASDVGVNPS